MEPIERSDVVVDLGPCCSCGEAGPTVRNVLLLDKKAPLRGTGWACLVCKMEPDGAIAVLCEACFEAKREPVWACRGRPALDGRVPIQELCGEHKHDLTIHERLERAKNSRWN